jgi:hypothetical protein
MRIVMRSAYPLITCIMVISLLGCATTRMYPGPSLPPDQVAFIQCLEPGVIFIAIDGQKNNDVNSFIAYRPLEILPGEHTIALLYGAEGKQSARPATVTFTAKAGARYLIKSNADGMRWAPSIAEIEKERK